MIIYFEGLEDGLKEYGFSLEKISFGDSLRLKKLGEYFWAKHEPGKWSLYKGHISDNTLVSEGEYLEELFKNYKKKDEYVSPFNLIYDEIECGCIFNSLHEWYKRVTPLLYDNILSSKELRENPFELKDVYNFFIRLNEETLFAGAVIKGLLDYMCVMGHLEKVFGATCYRYRVVKADVKDSVSLLTSALDSVNVFLMALRKNKDKLGNIFSACEVFNLFGAREISVAASTITLYLYLLVEREKLGIVEGLSVDFFLLRDEG